MYGYIMAETTDYLNKEIYYFLTKVNKYTTLSYDYH